jgi:tetratricopeptide (TPR) repeat protein
VIDGADALLAAQLYGTLWHYWAIHGHLEEGRWWLQRTQALAEGGLSPLTQATLFNSEGSLAYYQGDEAGAWQLFGRGLELSHQAGDQWGMAFALDGLGAQAASQGDYDRATAYSEQSLSISRAIGDKWLSGITLLNLGEIARARRDCRQALECYEEGMALLKERETACSPRSPCTTWARWHRIKASTTGRRPSTPRVSHCAKTWAVKGVSPKLVV